MKNLLTLFLSLLGSIALAGTNVPLNFDNSTGNVANIPPTVTAINFPTGKLTINGVAPQTGGLTSFNTRTGAVTLTAADVNALTLTLVTPALGTPSSVTLTNGTGLPVSTGLTGLGANVSTALGNAANGPGGLITANSSGAGTPNILTTQPFYLAVGFYGPVNGTTYRSYQYLVMSTDGVNWSLVPGLGNYQTTGGYYAINNTCFQGSDGSLVDVAGVEPGSGSTPAGYVDVCKSTDLANFTSVGHITTSIVVPQQVRDNNGSPWIVGWDRCKQNTSGDGVTWGSDNTITVTGQTVNPGDEAAVNYSGTIGLFYCTSAASTTYRIATTSGANVAGTYTDAASPVISNWPVAEALCVYGPDGAGKYTAIMNSRVNGHTIASYSTTPLVPSSWSVPVDLTALNLPGTFAPFYSQDGQGGFTTSSLDLFQKAITAQAQRQSILSWQGSSSNPTSSAWMTPGSSLVLQTGGTATYGTGTGTISSDSTTGYLHHMTGSGTIWTQELKYGSHIYDASRTHGGDVIWVNNDTDIYVWSNSGGAFNAGSFTYQESLFNSFYFGSTRGSGFFITAARDFGGYVNTYINSDDGNLRLYRRSDTTGATFWNITADTTGMTLKQGASQPTVMQWLAGGGLTTTGPITGTYTQQQFVTSAASFTLKQGFNVFTGTTASQTATLPTPVSVSGSEVVFKNQSSQTITIASNSGSQIIATGATTASASVTVATGIACEFWSDGTNWNQK